MLGLFVVILVFLGGIFFWRGSGDIFIFIDIEVFIREIKDFLVEVEEKYKKVMVFNV